MTPNLRSFVSSIALSIIAGCVLLGILGRPAAEASQAASSLIDSYLYRFEPATQTFITISLSADSRPADLIVTGTNPAHIWLTDPGLNQLAHVVYTNTADYQLTERAITSTANSQPYRLTLVGTNLWFTERGANRIGRLNINTGQLDEFSGNGLPPNAGLADIKVAPNGWVWITGQSANQLIRLVVTSTSQYAFTAYTHTLLVAPYDLAIESSNSVWFTLPSAGRIGQFTPSTGLFLWPSGLPANSQPTEIVVTPDTAWFSDPRLNQIGQVEIGTSTIVNSHGPVAQPVGIASKSANEFWVTQRSALGAIGRMVYTSPVSSHFDSYPFPTRGLFPTGIAVAADNGVWAAVFVPVRVYLPLVVKN